MKFPLVEAYLLVPEEGKEGRIGLCTNTVAPSLVINEIPFAARRELAVLGSLVVNRDGAERMILNCLSHPTLQYLILFGEETLSFRPSTNLLSALMHGYTGEKGNQIVKGKGIAHHYPTISEELLDKFRTRMKVLPLYKHDKCDGIVDEYMTWLQEKIPPIVYNKVKEIRSQKKIYYDTLVELIEIISSLPKENVQVEELDPSLFQHLSPPVIKVEDVEGKEEVPFATRVEGKEMVVDIDLDKPYTIKSNDSFLLAYSLMKFMNEKELTLPPSHQLLLGAELSRVEVEIRNDIATEPITSSSIKERERESIPIAARTLLKADKEYYYKVGLKEENIYVQSMAHDTCAKVFELRSTKAFPLLHKLAIEDRFQQYEQEMLHRLDVGIEVGRAAIALATGNSFFQDFRNLFSLNTSDFPLFIVEGDTFLNVHQHIITSLYTKGLTTDHPDTHKGPMRSGSILAVFRGGESLEHMPRIYSQGDVSVEEMRESYKAQLLSTENEGEYTYGERTRKHFGFDQLQAVVEQLQRHPQHVAVIQRFDFEKDMYVNEKGEATHDPCLSHDIYWLQDNKLHSFHIARAHNIVNAYPENIFGLHDAYNSFVAEQLKVDLGDMFMLSSRGNLLLLTEEQKAKQLIAEPSKPQAEVDVSSGPVNMDASFPSQGVGYVEKELEEVEKTEHACLATLQQYDGQNIIEKASNYLQKRGKGHNNPVIGTYNPRERIVDEEHRLLFFQCNNRGEKLHATAVFVMGSKERLQEDIELCNYLATQYGKKLDRPLGKLFLFYVGV